MPALKAFQLGRHLLVWCEGHPESLIDHIGCGSPGKKASAQHSEGCTPVWQLLRLEAKEAQPAGIFSSSPPCCWYITACTWGVSWHGIHHCTAFAVMSPHNGSLCDVLSFCHSSRRSS